MAEFLQGWQPGSRIAPPPEVDGDDGFAAMGKPVPMHRRQAAYQHAKQMGLDPAKAWHCIERVAGKLERDEPYDAMASGMQFLDLTGTYRLMAVLLSARAPEQEEEQDAISSHPLVGYLG